MKFLASINIIIPWNLFIYYQFTRKDGYNTKGEPVQGAIQHITTTNTKAQQICLSLHI